MDKKSKILKSALRLFAELGFHGTSTAKIAKEAGVSEGLLFRHFQSKRGLLDAIMHEIEEKVREVFAEIIALDDPPLVIRRFIERIYAIPESEYDYWRLSFKLKWDREFYNPEEMKPVLRKLEWAFRKLGRAHPKIEAEMLSQNVESIAVAMLRGGRKSQLKFKNHLINKYLHD